MIVRPGKSGFWVDPLTNRRIIYLNEKIVKGGSRSMLLREAAHELVHAEQFAKEIIRQGGDVSAARRIFQTQSSVGFRYAVDEVVAEKLAQRRIASYLGRLSNPAQEWSERYLRDWRSKVCVRRSMRK